MQDRPTANELLAAVREHLERAIVPQITEPRLKFQTLVCMNAIGIVERELLMGETLATAEWASLSSLLGEPADAPPTNAERAEAVTARTRQLCNQIRAGSWDDPERKKALFTHVRATVKTKLFVANPRYKSLGE
jgi:hypothetical protein